MSAFAAFKPASSEVYVESKVDALPVLLESMATCSSFVPSFSNTILKPNSILHGLHKDEYLIFRGNYTLKVHSGAILLNNLHPVVVGSSHLVITNSSESLPIISCCSENRSELESNDLNQLFPSHDSIIEIFNVDNGLPEIGDLYPPLEDHYFKGPSAYSFELILPDLIINCTTVYLDRHTQRSLVKLAKESSTLVVYGVPTSGKTTIAKSLLNTALLLGNLEVAYLDLDPESTSALMPGCLSYTLHSKPVYGSFLPSQKSSNPKDLHYYWGFQSYLTSPLRYLQLCGELIQHHQGSDCVPLIVKFPSYIKGYGRDILAKIVQLLEANHLIYLTHRNAVQLNGFEASDAFEAQDNPDSEVTAPFREFTAVKSLRAVRKSSEISKKDLFVRNKLLHFHQTEEGNFDFKPIISQLPSRLSFKYISAISVLNYDLDDTSLAFETNKLAEATIMGIFVSPQKKFKTDGLYLNGLDFLSMNCQFICLCLVHSLDLDNNFVNLYLPLDSNCPEKLQIHLEKGKKLILARGEGVIPSVEMVTMDRFEPIVPYIDSAAKKRIGGVWKPRRGISRKNQG